MCICVFYAPNFPTFHCSCIWYCFSARAKKNVLSVQNRRKNCNRMSGNFSRILCVAVSSNERFPQPKCVCTKWNEDKNIPFHFNVHIILSNLLFIMVVRIKDVLHYIPAINSAADETGFAVSGSRKTFLFCFFFIRISTVAREFRRRYLSLALPIIYRKRLFFSSSLFSYIK